MRVILLSRAGRIEYQHTDTLDEPAAGRITQQDELGLDGRWKFPEAMKYPEISLKISVCLLGSRAGSLPGSALVLCMCGFIEINYLLEKEISWGVRRRTSNTILREKLHGFAVCWGNPLKGNGPCHYYDV